MLGAFDGCKAVSGPVGSAGMGYMIASNQALAFDASVRQMPYGNDPSITTMLRYSIGF